MRIRELRVTPINLPLEAPLCWAGGLFPGTTKLVIEVETDEGLVGLGEAPSADLYAAVVSMGARLVGLDPLDIAACEQRCVPPWQIVQNTDDSTAVRAFGSIEPALWDLRGKAWHAPVYQLLGGAVRREIPFTEYFGRRVGRELTPEAIVDYCLRMRSEHGSTLFEGKLSFGDPHLEVEAARQLRQALGPTTMIRLDANMQYSLTTARRLLKELEPFNIRNYEDPVAPFEDLRALRQHSAIPFSSHVPDVRRAVSLGVPDAIVAVNDNLISPLATICIPQGSREPSQQIDSGFRTGVELASIGIVYKLHRRWEYRNIGTTDRLLSKTAKASPH